MNDQYQGAMSPQEIAQMLQQRWLSGQGRVTQLPGTPAESTRKYYKRHKGYDFGVNAGTPIYAPADVEVLGAGQQGGYGNRLSVYDPQQQTTAYLSHLSKIAVAPGTYQKGALLGYTGGVPGAPGAGNTTGAHLDIEYYPGRVAWGGSTPATTLMSTNNPQNYAQQLLARARQQYGDNIMAVASNPEQLQQWKDLGYNIQKITV